MLGWELPPNNSGGLGVACYSLCQALSRSQVDIEFIVPYLGHHSADFMTVTASQPAGVKVFREGGSAYDSYKYVFSDGRQQSFGIFEQQKIFEESIASTTEGKAFDIVHAHDWLTFRAALRLKEERGCPIVLHVHSIESDRAGGKPGNPLVHEIEATSLNLADKVVAVSQFTKDSIIRDYNIPPDKIEVVHNKINLNQIEPLDSENAYHYLSAMRAQGYRIIVNIGRLTIQKGLNNLLQAFKDVVAYEPKTLLLIVGAGELHYELLEMSADLGISRNVIFTGFLRGKAWRDAYAIGDLFVLPSVSEPFGLTPLEAIGYQTPVLVSRQSGVSEVLKHCLKVDFWDTKEMTNKIVSVVRSDALRQNLQANAVQEVSSQSWDQAADKLLAVYRRALNAGVAV